MKLTIALIAAARANKVARQADDSDRRYSQLVDMMSHYNPTFDERKYWAYGCNCLILGNSTTCPSPGVDSVQSRSGNSLVTVILVQSWSNRPCPGPLD